MILISYDISDTKLRTRFSKYIKKYGHMVQYSVYEITNSSNFLDKIENDILYNWEPKFGQEDSVIIVKTSKTCKISRFGYAKNEEKSVLLVD